jgi:hypothetical protein
MRTSALLGLLLLQACATEPAELSGPREVTVAWQIKGVGDLPGACPVGYSLQIDSGATETVPCNAADARTVLIEPSVSSVALSLVTEETIRTSTVVDLTPDDDVLDIAIYPEAAQLAANWGLVSRTGGTVSCASAGVDTIELHYAIHDADAEIRTAQFPCDAAIGIPPALELGVYVGQLHALSKGVEVGTSTGMFFVLDEYNTVNSSDAKIVMTGI